MNYKIKNADGQAKAMKPNAEMKRCAEYMGNNGENAAKVARKLVGGQGEKKKYFGD
mgnify:CR=1 FL=1